MSNILAVDTSTQAAGYAISLSDKIVASLTVNTGRPHSQNLFPTISTLCQIAGVELEEIDLFAAVTGPGSFTGLRVGLAAVKGLADSLGKPVLGRTALDLLALSSGRIGLHLIAISAGRNEFFCGMRAVDEAGSVSSLVQDRVCKSSLIGDLYAESLHHSNLTLIIEGEYKVGEFDELRTKWNTVPHQVIWSRRERLHLASYLALLAGEPAKSGLLQTLTPYYIRPSDAEIKKTTQGLSQI